MQVVIQGHGMNHTGRVQVSLWYQKYSVLFISSGWKQNCQKAIDTDW